MMNTQQIQTSLQSNVRAAMQIVSRTLTMAGYGLGMPNSQLEYWITWVSDFDSNPKLIDGSSGTPDRILIAGAFSRTATLSSDMTMSDQIVLNSGEGPKFNTSNKKLIYIGGLELARVRSRSGDTLTISTHPSLNAGLHNDYPAGTSVELVEVREFAIDSDGGPQGETVLTMDNFTTAGTYIEQLNQALYYRVAAIGIEDLQFTPSTLGYEVRISGVAIDPDPSYEGHTDGLRRFSMEQNVDMRNL
jgi:hypothetical protein